MKQVQRGFTLIELVMVIVILGVLAAVAIPKFVDLKGEAQVAALQGVVGGINSASAVNYAARSAAPAKGTATAVSTCDVAAARILQGGIPSGYNVETKATAVGDNSCIVYQGTSSVNTGTATATIIGIL